MVLKLKDVFLFGCAADIPQRDSPRVHEWTGTGPTKMGFTRRFATRVGDDSYMRQEGRISSHPRIVATQLAGGLIPLPLFIFLLVQ